MNNVPVLNRRSVFVFYRVLVLFTLLSAPSLHAAIRHVTVAEVPDKFLGWPANCGLLWSWGEELLVGFTAAEFKYRGPDQHPYAPQQGQDIWLARSRDGGENWIVEKPDALRGHKNVAAAPIAPPRGDIVSANPNLAIIVGYEDEDRGYSWFQVSPDRGRTWGPRQRLPDFGFGGVGGRSDYLLSGANDALFLLTGQSAHKPKEGRVFAARTRDGGKTWTREGLVGPDPKDGFSIQSSTVRLDAKQLVSVTRFQTTSATPRAGLQVHRSDDDGRTWRTLDVFVDTGKRSTAASLTRLRDGRLALTYAQRDHAQICARFSHDAGETWSDEMILRDGGGNWDIGYTRTTQRADGQLVTAYYWNDDPTQHRYIAATIWAPPAKQSLRASDAQHVVVHHRPWEMAAWPANGGLWTWDDGAEALVGFCVGAFKEQAGHNILPPYTNLLARTRDGGRTWQTETPASYAQEYTAVRELTAPVDFSQPGLALRMMAAGYHGSTNGRGGFLYSYDRGHSWNGPFRFAGLEQAETLRDWENTTRTDYLVFGGSECLLLLSARQAKVWGDRTFAVRTADGGRSFTFLNWIVGPGDPYRAVMPATTRCSSARLVSALRRREPEKEHCWIDAYVSEDNGVHWQFSGKVGETGGGNGNPPALIRLRDGRLCCVYGQRDRNQMLARYGRDDGATWGEEIILRDNYQADKFHNADLGYPRLFERPDGRIVAIYYWADRARPEPHIAATSWTPSINPTR